MKYTFVKTVVFVVISMAAFTSCVMEPEDVDYDEVEQDVLDLWMAANEPEATRWEDGYFTYILDEGDMTEQPIHKYADCWVRYNLTGYDFEGNILVTRDELTAYQIGAWTDASRYVPLYQDLFIDLDYYDDEYIDYDDPEEYDYLPECLNLAFKNEVLELRKGSKLIMYVPSDIIDGADIGSTGFMGSTTLGYYNPMKMIVEVVDVVAEPYADEVASVEEFMTLNGGFVINYRESDYDSTDSDADEIDSDYLEAYNEAQELIPENWSNAFDTVRDLYLYRRFTFDTPLTFANPYTSDAPESVYNEYTMAEIDALIKDIVEENFLEAKMTRPYMGFTSGGTIWYIGRFMDGFIFDTNIADVRDLITDDISSYSTGALDFWATDAPTTYILSWYYAIPQLRYGQWATMITTSKNAYGEVTLSDDIPAYTPLIFHIYVEPDEYEW